MNSNLKTAAVLFAVTISVIACKKSEISEYGSPEIADSAAVAVTSDSISMAATQEVEGKKFIKTADVNMEVKNVYESTISIDKYLKKWWFCDQKRDEFFGFIRRKFPDK